MVGIPVYKYVDVNGKTICFSFCSTSSRYLQLGTPQKAGWFQIPDDDALYASNEKYSFEPDVNGDLLLRLNLRDEYHPYNDVLKAIHADSIGYWIGELPGVRVNNTVLETYELFRAGVGHIKAAWKDA